MKNVVSRFQLSKRRAAERMLKLLETLPPPPRPAINNVDRKRYAKRLAYVKTHTRKFNGSVNSEIAVLWSHFPSTLWRPTVFFFNLTYGVEKH